MFFLAIFLQVTEEYYGATLAEVYFQTQPEESARDTINQWVAAQTQENITDLIPAGVLNPSTRLVLTNAIFQRNWLYFAAKNTQEKSFTTELCQEITVPMMDQKNRFWYGQLKFFNYFIIDYLK